MPSSNDIPPLPGEPFRFILHFVWRFRLWYIAIVFVEIGTAVTSILIPYAIGATVHVVSSTVSAGTGLTNDALFAQITRGPLVLFCALAFGEVVFARIGGACQIWVGPRLRASVARDMYAYLQNHSHRYFTSHFAGSLAHRISETSAGVSQTLWAVLFDFLPIFVTLLVSTVLLYRTSGQLAAVMLGWSVVFVSMSYALARRCQPHAQRSAAARSETNGKIVDAVSNLASVRLFSRFDYEISYLARFLARETRISHQSGLRMEFVRWFQFIAAMLLKIITLYLAVRLWRDGKIGVGSFVTTTSLALLVISDTRNLSRRFLEFFEFVGNVENGVRTIVRPIEIVDRPDARDASFTQGSIVFRDVRFGYKPERPVFHHLNLSIEAGQRVGLVGFSGSGKSTLVNLILRLYDPQSGSIEIDGIDIRDLRQTSLRAQIGLIPQDPSLFHRSLAENIGYGDIDASDDLIHEAARRAHADGFIGKLDEGYDSLVGERGVTLSGGQRQRIAIARVIAKDAPILILDEATSSLDSVTERAIQDTIDDVSGARTVIVIAHRLSTIAHLDRILVFDAGRIVEDGTHASLIASGGRYAQLWTSQYGELPARRAVDPSPAFDTRPASTAMN
ncbi:MAG TPA: ABC transporter ATP-binding protein [Pararobbsia sp.]|nr:ABC transporter ATP-binding protein [Pararobbsia sp.]